MYSNSLYHHGVKGMKWGVRRYQNKDGSLKPAGRGRYDGDDGGAKSTPNAAQKSTPKAGSKGSPSNTGQKIEEKTDKWGYQVKKVSYENKSASAKKANLDRNADDYDIDAMSDIDDAMTSWGRDRQQKGEEYANKVLHEKLKDYSYELTSSPEVDEGENYVNLSLTVIGNKSFYQTFGYYRDERDSYTDGQQFDYNDQLDFYRR